MVETLERESIQPGSARGQSTASLEGERNKNSKELTAVRYSIGRFLGRNPREVLFVIFPERKSPS